MTAKKTKKTEDSLELQERIVELENNWKRALADYQNLEKRMNEEKTQVVEFANANLLSRMLGVLDNLEMLFAHNGDKTLEMVIKDFKNVLHEEKVEEIEACGQDFDSSTMDALETIKGEDGKVMEVVRKGYMFKNKLLRPALVKVGKNTTFANEDKLH